MTLEEFCATATKYGAAKSPSNLRQYLNILFKDIDFNGKSFLDIGGGTGVFVHFAAWSGATRSVCLEPEHDGSTSGVTEKFSELATALGVQDRATLQTELFQEYTGEPFDFVLLHNSINHLDEPACISLIESSESKETYLELFRKLNGIVAPGGSVIICDCGRRNFFADLGLKNPVMPDIEWNKHQQPETWGDLLEQTGFVTEGIRWNTFNTLGRIGPLLLGYFIPSYFTLSHFRLYVKKAQ